MHIGSLLLTNKLKKVIIIVSNETNGDDMKTSQRNALIASPLFRSVDPPLLGELIRKADGTVIDFTAGDEILLKENGKNRIGIVLNGALLVYSGKDEKALVNRLTASSPIGISHLHYDGLTGIRILANESSSILFFTEENAEILWENPVIRKNLISFMSDRIRFLNRRIASFTAPGSEGKLARYLSQNSDQNGKLTVNRSFTTLAKSLNLGRASLYRAMQTLTEDGAIEKNGKTLTILSEFKLRHYFN